MDPTSHAAADLAFADLLRAHRRSRSMTQERLAESARLSVEAISALERGVRRAPQRATISLLASGLALDRAEAERFHAVAAAQTVSSPRNRRRRDSAAIAGVPSALPPGTGVLVGRDADVAALATLIATRRLVTIVGAGGIGKTTLALAVARGDAARRFDSAAFVSLASARTANSVAETISRALGAALATDRPADESIAALCAERSMLIVLDNCEHVVDDVAPISARLLERCPNVTLIATSRQGLGIWQETIYRTGTLSIPAAMQLFCERAAEVDPSFALTEATGAIVRDICVRLDGIALAIELAARRVRVLALPELRSHLDQRFRLLANASAAEPRQRTLRSLVDWSYDLLTTREQAFFNQLSVFAGGFTLEGARAVALENGDVFDALDLLDSLVAKSLVVRTPGDTAIARYAMLETLRAYGAERLQAAGERPSTARRFIAYVEATFAEAGDAYDREARFAIVEELDLERENFLAALDASEAAGDVRAAARLLARAPALRRWLSDRDAVARLARIAAACDEEREPGLVAILWLRNGSAKSRVDAAGAFVSFERALALARRAGESSTAVRSLAWAALERGRLGRSAEAAALLGEAATLAASPEAAKELRHGFAVLALYRNDFADAAERWRAIADDERSRGNDGFEFNALINLASAEAARGDARAALAAVTRAEPLHASGTPYDRRRFFAHGAVYAIDAGHPAHAAHLALRAIDVRPHDAVLPIAFGYAALALALARESVAAAQIDGYVSESLRCSDVVLDDEDRRARARTDAELRSLAEPRRAMLRERGSRLGFEAARAVVAEACASLGALAAVEPA